MKATASPLQFLIVPRRNKKRMYKYPVYTCPLCIQFLDYAIENEDMNKVIIIIQA